MWILDELSHFGKHTSEQMDTVFLESNGCFAKFCSLLSILHSFHAYLAYHLGNACVNNYSIVFVTFITNLGNILRNNYSLVLTCAIVHEKLKQNAIQELDINKIQ